MEVGGNSDAGEAVVFYEDVGLLRCAVLKACAEPRVDVAWNVDGGCSNEVVPANSLEIEPA